MHIIITGGQFGVLLLVALFLIVAFGGFCYQKGQSDARLKSKETADNREAFLKSQGFDPRPFHKKTDETQPESE
jgi:hypothetical protein